MGKRVNTRKGMLGGQIIRVNYRLQIEARMRRRTLAQRIDKMRRVRETMSFSRMTTADLVLYGYGIYWSYLTPESR